MTLFFHRGPALGPLAWAHGGLAALFWLALLALVIVGLVILLRRPQYPAAAPPQLSPLEILNLRYARGEIDAATYQEMRARILAGDPPPTNL